MKPVRKFIVVDDDPFNNILCRLVLETALEDVEVKTFTEPEQGLDYIKNTYQQSTEETVLFLDINMPTLTGWEFLDQYQQLGEELRKKIDVYILSSSVDDRDQERAAASPLVKGFLSKPLEPEMIQKGVTG